jgi:hypothetical protein
MLQRVFRPKRIVSKKPSPAAGPEHGGAWYKNRAPASGSIVQEACADRAHTSHHERALDPARER